MHKINIIKFFSIISILTLLIPISSLNAKIIKNIVVNGNERISNETIKLFSEVSIGDDVTTENLIERQIDSKKT